jgi:hypothetical protein
MSAATMICPDCGEPGGARYGPKQICWACYERDLGGDGSIPEPEQFGENGRPRDKQTTGALTVEIDAIEDFAAFEEPGADPLIGHAGEVLIPQGGDVMVYGEGGAGKTTLVDDAACHLAAGRDWLGMPIPRRARVLLVENEGPRPLLRAKLRAKLAVWDGPDIAGGVQILAAPWASFTFADEQWRTELARIVDEHEIDVIIAGPLTRIGMDSAGTLQEVAAFAALIDDVRRRCGRRVAVILVHHENKGGTVSGAWEGAGDTLLHVEAAGPGRTILRIQKARWASDYHGRTLKLKWTDGEGFEVEADRDLLAEIEALFADGKWRTINEVRVAVGAGKESVEDVILKDNADRFQMRTGEDARALERSPKAKLYQVAP